MPDLSCMTYSQLSDISAALRGLADMCGMMRPADRDALVFDLTPGQPVRITTAFTVFDAPLSNPESYSVEGPSVAESLKAAFSTPTFHRSMARPAGEPQAEDDDDAPWLDVTAIANGVLADMGIAVPGGPAVPAPPGPSIVVEADRGPALSPPAAPNEGGAAVEPVPVADAAAAGTDAQPEAEPQIDPVAPPPAAVVIPPPAARATVAGGADKTVAPLWTDAEEARLIELVAARLADGKSMRVAAYAAADLLNRPQEGTYFRSSNKLRAQILAASEKLRAPLPAAPRPEASAAPAKAPPVLAGAGWSYPRANGWTMDEDADLLDFALKGWGVPEIAMEMQKDSRAVKQRFEDLTHARTFKRDDVRAAIEVLLASRQKRA